jgi:hypothetical protein
MIHPEKTMSQPKASQRATFRMTDEVEARIHRMAEKTSISVSKIISMSVDSIVEMAESPGREKIPWIVVFYQQIDEYAKNPPLLKHSCSLSSPNARTQKQSPLQKKKRAA